MLQRLCPLVLLCPLAIACGEAPKQARIVEAFTIESEQAKVAEAMAAKEAERKRLEAQARRDKRAAIEAAIDEAARQPTELPPDLDVACDGVVEAYDAYMKSGSESDALRWSDGRRRKMGERRAACVTMGKIPVAACEAQALRAAPAVLDEIERTTAARRLMERCHDKFGKS